MGLVKNVQVGGVWYGPAYGSTEVGEGIPEDVAAEMGAHLWEPGTEPKAASGGVLKVEVKGKADPDALAAIAKSTTRRQSKA